MTRGVAFFGGSSPFVGPLDSYTTNLWSAMSLCRLLTSWTSGPLVSYDTTEATTHDAIFGADGPINSTELVEWGGAHTQTMQAFRNQQGTSNQGMSGAVAADYPTLVNAGSYLGYAEFDGSSDGLATGTTIAPTGITIFFRGKLRDPADATDRNIFEHTTNADTNNAFFIVYNASGLLRVGNHKQTPGGYSISDYSGVYPDDNVHCYRIDRSQASSVLQNVMFVNGTKQTRSGNLDTGTFPTGAMGSGGIYMGSRNLGASNLAKLNAHTVVIYNAALSDTDCTDISDIIAALP